MKRHLVLASLALGLTLSLVGCSAKPVGGLPQVGVKSARVGFPGGDDDLFKPGHWTPVYVDLVAGTAGIKAGQYALVVTTGDVDNVGNQYTVPLPAADPFEPFTVTTYTKPPGNPEITVAVRELVKEDETRPPQLGHTVDSYGSDKRYLPQQPDSSVYLTLGARLPDLKKSLPSVDSTQARMEQVASLDAVEKMPTQWFGYDGVDVVFLGTSSATFTKALVGDERRWNALAEWVRRGGRLVVSAGQNQDLVAALDKQQPLLPMTVTGERVKIPSAGDAGAEEGVHRLAWYANGGDFRLLDRRGGNGEPRPIELTRLQPKDASDPSLKPDAYRETEWLAAADLKAGPPLLVRGTYGMGQVLLVATDLDQMPFREKDSSSSDFWKKLRSELGTKQETQASKPIPGGFGIGPTVPDVASRLENNLQHFEDIPVIGFGWVALFILLYIVVVGPLDYLFLKKVLKRLELTWITFPAVVLVISVAAYFTAYWIKGDKLKINKLDVVDIDLHTEQVYGHTWFTLFSPRIDHYTIGVEPAAQWAPGEASATATLVSWMDKPETNTYGRSRSQSFFRRTYDYEPNATGLRGVPIQVWSTKSFAASWQVPTRKQLFSHTLRHPANQPTALSGTITSHLPVELEDVSLLYHQAIYKLDRLPPEVEMRLNDLPERSLNWGEWYAQAGQVRPITHRGTAGSVEPTDPLVKTILFFQDAMTYRSSGSVKEHDSSLGQLDQSWRLRHCQDEVILFGRLPRRLGEAKSVAEDPSSPSRLWLNELPQSGKKWPGLSGTLQQETFVRIFIPVHSQAKAGGD